MPRTGRDDFEPPRLAQAAAGHVHRLLKEVMKRRPLGHRFI